MQLVRLFYSDGILQCQKLYSREMKNDIISECEREGGSGVSVMEAGRKGKTKGESENGNREEMETERSVTVMLLLAERRFKIVVVQQENNGRG